jgi:hypothetical protein
MGRAAAAVMVAGLSLACLACRSTPLTREALLEEFASEASSLEDTLTRQPEPASGALRVTLAFGPEADLDLFVTGPRHESVYFANTPSATGGALVADLRCGAAAPRLETIIFPSAPQGIYRVGVDFPERCFAGVDAVAFAVSVAHRGQRGLSITRGIIRPGEFLTIVLETEIR